MKIKLLYKNWFVHNVFAHPLMWFIGLISNKLAAIIHDATLPES